MLLMAPLRILCFGDSLTWGLTEGFTQHAYAMSLQSSLEASLSGQKVIADNKGQNGDLVVSPPGEFLPRITTIYEENPSLYDWAVILGGTNDLGWGHKADEMYEGIQKVWDIPLSNGTKVLALTVPECGVKPMCSPELTARRDAYNAYILAHKQENLYTYDFHADIPWESMPEKKRKKMWADGVHFTPQGYDFMGSRIAERIVEVISEIEHVENGFTQDSAQKPIVAQNTVIAQKWWKSATSRFRNGKDPKVEVLGTSLRNGNAIFAEEEVYAAR